MKLHLPKQLFTALLSAITLATPAAVTLGSAAWANSGLHNNANYLLGGTGAGGTAQGTYTGLQETTLDGKVTTLVTELNAEALATFNLWADDSRNAWTNALVGALRVQDGATIKVSESIWKHENGTVVRYFDELHIENLYVAGEGDVVLNVSLASHNVTIDNVSGTLSSVTNAGNLTLGEIGSSVTLGGNITNTGTLTLQGDIYGTSTITGGTVNLVDFSNFGNLTFGAVQVSGVLGMTSDGTMAWDSLELAEGTILEYGKGANTLNLGAIDKSVTLYLYEVEESLRSESGVNLGISLGEGQTLESIKGFLQVDGLASDASFNLIERDGAVYMTSTGVLDSGWDYHWGASVLANRPTTSSVLIADPTTLSSQTNGSEKFYMVQNSFTAGEVVSVELTGEGDYSANAVIVGGFATTTNDNSQGVVERDVWIKASAGQYKAIVGGNVADNWGGGGAAHFAGDTHILVDGATVGAIIGGTYRDGKTPVFTGDTYISVLSGDVKDCIFGAAANTHNNTATFNGNTNIYIYVPLENNASGSTIGNNGAVNAIVGGAGKVANDANAAKSYINGNTNVTIDLSGYNGALTTFAKQIVGGSKNIANSYFSQITGNTYVNILGKDGITFTKEVIGGSAFSTDGTAKIYGTTNVLISGGVFTSSVVGGSYATANSTNTVDSSCVQISGGSFSGSLVGGNLVSGTGTNTVGNSSVQISGGTFTNVGNNGGNGDSPYTHLIVGGSMLTADTNGTSLTSVSTKVEITGGSIATDIYGGHVDKDSGSATNAITATLQNATVTLNGADAEVANIYGGSFTKRDNSGENAAITQGSVLVDLVAGTVNGNVYAGGRQLHRTKITTGTTEVRISDAVEFTSDSAVVSGGYQMGCADQGHQDKAGENPSVVTGTKTLVFTGGSQNRSGIMFDSFDTVDVVSSASVVTIDSLSNSSSLNKVGAGTLKLSGILDSLEELEITAGALEAECADNLTFAGNISGDGTFTKSGAGQLTLDSSKTSVSNLKVNAGEIIYNSTTNTTHTLTGAAGSKFTKMGSSMLTVSSDSYSGDIEVSAGTLQFSGSNESATNDMSRKVTVHTGAKLDLNGKARHYEVVLNEDSTLTNTGAATGDGQRQLHTITLNGDATVSGTGNFYLINNGYTTTYLNLNQHTLTKTGGNTFYLKNTTVQSAGVIRVEDGIVQTLSSNEGVLNISKASLEIADKGRFVLDGKSQQIQNLTLEAGGTLTVNSGYTLTAMGDVTWSGGTISGNLCLAGTVSQTGGTVDISNAVLSGVSLSYFDKVGSSALPENSGVYEAIYKLVDGSVSLTSGEQPVQGSITVGGQSYALDLDTGTFAVNSNYYVASGDSITISAESANDPISQATYFYVDGTLNVAGVVGNGITVKDILVSSGGAGKLVLNTTATLSDNTKTTFNGTLSIGENGTLNFGYVKSGGSDMSSFSKVELDGGTLNYNNLDSTLNNFTVTENGGTMYMADYKDRYTAPVLLAGITDIQGAFNYNTEYKSYLQIEKLVGTGTFTISTETANNRSDGGAHVQIDSLGSFSGNIVLTPESNGTNRVEVTASLAKGDSLKASQITINNANKASFTLTGCGLYDMGSSTAAIVSGLTDSTSWTGTVKLSGIASAGGMDLNNFGNAASAVKLDGVNGWFARTQDGTTDRSVKPHIILGAGGISFDDYSTSGNYNFTKGISGSGNFVIDAKNASVSACPTILIGSSSTGTWSGAFLVNDIQDANYVQLFLNGNGVYFDSQTATSGVEMNDAGGTLSVFVGYATPNLIDANAAANFTAPDQDASNGTSYVTTVDGAISNKSTGTLNLTAINNAVFNKDVDVSNMTVNSGKTATMNATLKAGTVTNNGELKLADKATISGGSMSGVQMNSDSISGTATDGSKGAISNALVQLVRDSSFTIEDMTLTNTTITAATVDTHVDLKNVSGDVTLKTGIFGVEMTTVGRGGSALTYEEGAPSITLSRTDAGAAKLMISANPTVDVRGSYGTYTLTFNLNLQLDSSLGEPASNEAWGELVGFSGWLGTMLEEQGAIFAGAAGDPVAQSTAPSVSYGYSAGSGGSNVGTLVITINGLNVPEPTTSTLSLLALAGLCARRRRR